MSLFLRLMEEVLEPQLVYEKMAASAFGHKNGKVREETLYLLQKAICGKR